MEEKVNHKNIVLQTINQHTIVKQVSVIVQ